MKRYLLILISALCLSGCDGFDQLDIDRMQHKLDSLATRVDEAGRLFEGLDIDQPSQEPEVRPHLEIIANGLQYEYSDEETYSKLAEAGFTVVSQYMGHVVELYRTAMDAAEKSGMKVMASLHDFTYSYWIDHLTASFEQVQKYIDGIKDHPALWGYSFGDEPKVLHQIEGIKAVKDYMLQLDTEHVYFCNIAGCNASLPFFTYGISQDDMDFYYSQYVQKFGSDYINSYQDYLDHYMDTTQWQSICFDSYPLDLAAPNVEMKFYESLEYITAEAKKYGVPMWAYLASGVWNKVMPSPTEEGIKYQMYTCLAYGAQTICYYAYQGDEQNPLTSDGQYTATYDHVKATNIEANKRAFIFVGGEVDGVWHTADVPNRAKKFSNSVLPEGVSSLEAETAALVSVISNNGHKYLVVVSRTPYADNVVTIDFSKIVSHIDAEGEFQYVKPGSGRYMLKKGEALTFQIN